VTEACAPVLNLIDRLSCDIVNRHLHEVHTLDDKNAAQVRLQMQLVNQLDMQVIFSLTVYCSYIDSNALNLFVNNWL